MRRVVMYLMAGIILCFSSCDKAYEGQSFRVNPEDPISLYLESVPKFSDWVELLKKTGFFNTLNISSTKWTHFVADNDALRQYANEMGYNSIFDMDQADLEKIVRYHTIPGYEVSARNMSGKISRRTATKDFLTAVYDYNADWRYILNGEGREPSTIIDPDIEVTNGYIHELDRPLVIAFETIWDILNTWNEEDETAPYSIFIEALEKTGLDEYLKREEVDIELGPEGEKVIYTVREPKTVFAVPNSVYYDYSISNYDDLVAYIDQYSGGESKEPNDPNSYIYQYMEYHILDKRMAYNDLALFPLDPYSYDGIKRRKRQTIYPRCSVYETMKGISIEDQLAQLVFNPQDAQCTFYITSRDNPSSNGYIHVISNLGLKPKRMAFFPVEFELTDALPFTYISFYQEEIALNASPRTFEIYNGDIDFLSWTSTSADAKVWYSNEWPTDNTTVNRYKNYDALYWSLGTFGSLEIRIPTLPATGMSMHMRLYAEKSNNEYGGGRFNITCGKTSMGNNLDFRTGSKLAKWAGFYVGNNDANTNLLIKVGDMVGEGGIDRLIFMPSWTGGTAVPDEGGYYYEDR